MCLQPSRLTQSYGVPCNALPKKINQQQIFEAGVSKSYCSESSAGLRAAAQRSESKKPFAGKRVDERTSVKNSFRPKTLFINELKESRREIRSFWSRLLNYVRPHCSEPSEVCSLLVEAFYIVRRNSRVTNRISLEDSLGIDSQRLRPQYIDIGRLVEALMKFRTQSNARSELKQTFGENDALFKVQGERRSSIYSQNNTMTKVQSLRSQDLRFGVCAPTLHSLICALVRP